MNRIHEVADELPPGCQGELRWSYTQNKADGSLIQAPEGLDSSARLAELENLDQMGTHEPFERRFIFASNFLWLVPRTPLQDLDLTYPTGPHFRMHDVRRYSIGSVNI